MLAAPFVLVMTDDSAVRCACVAMRARFEIAVWGGSPHHLRAAAEAGLAEIERLGVQLSAFDPAGEVWDINARAADEPVRIDPRVFALLQRCARISHETDGAFDVTVGPLMSLWGFREDVAHEPTSEELRAALELTGMEHVQLDQYANSVRFARAGVRIDLGAIGKGYAVDCCVAVLRECEVGGALVHGGTSSVYALGSGPDGHPWRVAVRRPGSETEVFKTIELQNEALGVSAPHGRLRGSPDGHLGHVIDPRTGSPTRKAALAAVACRSAADADALSTALLVAGSTDAPFMVAREARGWLLTD